MPDPAYGRQPALSAAFTVTITRPATGVTLVGLAGELDLATSPTLDVHAADALREPACTQLILNVSHLSFCSAAGLGSLLQAQDMAHRCDIGVCLVSNPKMDRLLNLTDLDSQFVTFPHLTAALGAARLARPQHIVSRSDLASGVIALVLGEVLTP